MIEFFKENSEYLLLLGLVLVTFALMNNLMKRRRRQSANPQASALEQAERNRQLRGTRGALEDLMVEIEQMAKRVGAQLDAKAMHLERLITEADEKIRVMQQLADRASRAQPQPPPASAVDPLMSESADPFAVNQQMAAPVAESAADPLASTIYELADNGADAASIARQIDEHVGKVELILALREA